MEVVFLWYFITRTPSTSIVTIDESLMKTVLNHYGIVAGAIFSFPGKLYIAGTHHCDAVSIGTLPSSRYV